MKIHPKIKRVFYASLPSKNDFSLLTRFIVVLFVLATFYSIFQYSSTANAQNQDRESSETALQGVLIGLQSPANGCAAYIKDTSAITNTAGAGITQSQICGAQLREVTSAANAGTLVAFDYGATGRLLNASASTYDVNVAKPGTTLEYYASRARGTVMAQSDPTSGRNTLAPVLVLNQTMANLAYALVVIVLMVSGLSLLIGSLAGAEEKFTIVQLLINAGITILMITFYYEIAAIIFDLVVNYGNSLVASVMSPYINSYAILDRLQPGGDLGITAVLNTFQFVGVSDGLLTVVQNVFAGFYPALAQTSSSFFRSIAGEGLFPQGGLTNIAYSYSVGLAGSAASLGIAAVVTSFLGNTELISTIVAWVIFYLNIKIFINLLTAFLTFSITVGFGPLIVLTGVSGGFDKIKDSFKSLIAAAGVFPLTFLLILLGAASTNIRINDSVAEQTGNPAEPARQVLCRYSTSDPANTENSIIQSSVVEGMVDTLLPGNQSFLDPSDARARNFLNQRIFDTVPVAVDANGVPNCRPQLFPIPWTYIPAPFGSMGIRSLQSQTIDSLVRTFMGIIFIIMASRAPKILDEILEVKKYGFLDKLANPFKAGASGFFGVGATALSIGAPLGIMGAKSGLKYLGGLRLGGAFKGLDNFTKRIQAGRTAKFIQNQANPTLGKALSRLTNYDKGQLIAANMQEGIPGFNANAQTLQNLGFSQDEARRMAGDAFMQASMKIENSLNSLGNSLASFGRAVESITNSLVQSAGKIQNLIAISLDDL